MLLQSGCRGKLGISAERIAYSTFYCLVASITTSDKTKREEILYFNKVKSILRANMKKNF